MALPDGFWTVGLQGLKDNMNQCLVQFDTKANIDAQARKKGILYVATDENIVYYDDGAALQKMATIDLADMLERAHASLTGVGATDHHTAAILEALLTTKGDIIIRNGSTPIRVAVGAADDEVLTVDAAEASGVKWASSIDFVTALIAG